MCAGYLRIRSAQRPNNTTAVAATVTTAHTTNEGPPSAVGIGASVAEGVSVGRGVVISVFGETVAVLDVNVGDDVVVGVDVGDVIGVGNVVGEGACVGVGVGLGVGVRVGVGVGVGLGVGVRVGVGVGVGLGVGVKVGVGVGKAIPQACTLSAIVKTEDHLERELPAASTICAINVAFSRFRQRSCPSLATSIIMLVPTVLVAELGKLRRCRSAPVTLRNSKLAPFGKLESTMTSRVVSYSREGLRNAQYGGSGLTPLMVMG